MRKKLIASALTVVGAVVCLGVVTGATPAGAAVSCSYSRDSNAGFIQDGEPFVGREYAGHYGGLTVVPSSSQVTGSGEEAQCLLKRAGFDPGTIDGIFGPKSQAAMHAFQTDMNAQWGAGLATGPGQDFPGPNSWKWLRFYASLFG